jgi:hypothetical protein
MNILIHISYSQIWELLQSVFEIQIILIAPHKNLRIADLHSEQQL